MARGAPNESRNMPGSETTDGAINLLVLEGDGIGPEISAATGEVSRKTARSTDLPLSFDHAEIGFKALRARGTTFPDDVFEAAGSADGVILGPVSHNEYPPAEKGGLNPSGQLRKRLDLYANIRPARSRPGFPPRCGKPVDLVVVRENTEGFYADRSMHMGHGEIMPTPDLALSLRKVTPVHKANVLRISDGLFLDCVRSVAARHPDIAYDEKIVDAMAALLVRDAGAFDVIVTTNMFGDILSDEASEISGSLGLAASLNAGTDHALAQAQHGSAPDIAGKDKANPASLIG